MSLSLQHQPLIMEGESICVIGQMTGSSKGLWQLSHLVKEALSLASSLNISFFWIPGEANSMVDGLARGVHRESMQLGNEWYLHYVVIFYGVPFFLFFLSFFLPPLFIYVLLMVFPSLFLILINLSSYLSKLKIYIKKERMVTNCVQTRMVRSIMWLGETNRH